MVYLFNGLLLIHHKEYADIERVKHIIVMWVKKEREYFCRTKRTSGEISSSFFRLPKLKYKLPHSMVKYNHSEMAILVTKDPMYRRSKKPSERRKTSSKGTFFPPKQ